MKKYKDLISRSDFHAKSRLYGLSKHFYGSWKWDLTTNSLEAAVCLVKCKILRFRFPAFPVEMERLEMHMHTRKALVLLVKTGADPFPVSKTHFREKSLFFKAFRFPLVIYKYIYVGKNLHIYLICKNWPRKLSVMQASITKIIPIIFTATSRKVLPVNPDPFLSQPTKGGMSYV